MPVEDYVRNAVVTNVVDGDTLDLDIDLGFGIWASRRVRVLGVNAPEMTGKSRCAGQRAKCWVQRWVGESKGFVTVRTHLDKTDSFGRVLAEIWNGSQSLGRELIASGNAVAYRVTREKKIRQE